MSKCASLFPAMSLFCWPLQQKRTLRQQALTYCEVCLLTVVTFCYSLQPAPDEPPGITQLKIPKDIQYKRAMQRCTPLLHSLDKKSYSRFYPLLSKPPIAIRFGMHPVDPANYFIATFVIELSYNFAWTAFNLSTGIFISFRS